MDLRMPRCDGVEATRRIRAEYPGTEVVVLTTYADDDSLFPALQAGARGYLTKDAGARGDRPGHRRRALRCGRALPAGAAAAAGAALRTGAAPQRRAAVAEARQRALPDGLTVREAEVLALIARGPVQRRDRRGALRQPGHGEDPHQQPLREDRGARSGTGGQLCISSWHFTSVRKLTDLHPPHRVKSPAECSTSVSEHAIMVPSGCRRYADWIFGAGRPECPAPIPTPTARWRITGQEQLWHSRKSPDQPVVGPERGQRFDWWSAPGPAGVARRAEGPAAASRRRRPPPSSRHRARSRRSSSRRTRPRPRSTGRSSTATAFQEIRRSYRTFVFPATAVFLGWYLLYVTAQAAAPDLMRHQVAGPFSVAWLLGLLQFVSTFLITWLYSRNARTKRDRAALGLRWDTQDQLR